MAELNDLPPRVQKYIRPPERVQILRLYKALREQIDQGDLQPGQILRNQEIQEQHGTNKTVTTAAMGLLRLDGLVETRRGTGSRITHEGQGTWNHPQDAASHAEHIERTMRARLAERTYREGTCIPRVAQLAEEFGVGKRAVIQGLAPLFTEGYLRVDLQRNGTIVTPRITEVRTEDLLRLADRPRYDPTALYEAWGESKTLHDWGRDPRCVVQPRLLRERVWKHRWPLEKALTTPKLK